LISEKAANTSFIFFGLTLPRHNTWHYLNNNHSISNELLHLIGCNLAILKSVFLCGFYGKSRTKTPEKQVFKFKIKIKKITDLMYTFWMIYQSLLILLNAD
jgi:hypothetical protein